MWSKNIFNSLLKNSGIHRSVAFQRKNIAVIRSSSTQVQEVSDDTYIDIEKDRKPKKQRVLKKFVEPFPQSLFLGRCDPTVLEYPEVLDSEEIGSVTKLALDVNAFLEKELKSVDIDKSNIPNDLIKRLGDFKLYGLKIPWDYGGREYTETESVVMGEASAMDASVSKFVNEQHNVCCAILNLYGSEEQKERYLRATAEGSAIGACAYLEDQAYADTKSEMKSLAIAMGDSIQINGEKRAVYVADQADYFIVFANKASKDEEGKFFNSLCAFLVDRKTPGVSVHSPVVTPVLNGCKMYQVSFENVMVPTSAMIGKPNDGLKIMLTVMGDRFGFVPRAVAVCRKLITDVTNHCVNTHLMGIPMIDTEYVRRTIGKMSSEVYSLESSLYLRAGLADTHEDHSGFLEHCILKVLASKVMRSVVSDALQLLGLNCYKPEFQYLQRFIAESQHYSICEETDAILKLTICLTGLQHAGKSMNTTVKKMRNPSSNPWYYLRKQLFTKDKGFEKPTLHLGLEGYLHPSLIECALSLEYCIERLMKSTEIALIRNGEDILVKHTELMLLADLFISTYSVIASLGRASRSYCIGLSESETEMELAMSHAWEIRSLAKSIFIDIENGPVENNTNKYLKCAERIIANKSYCIESPIKRNF